KASSSAQSGAPAGRHGHCGGRYRGRLVCPARYARRAALWTVGQVSEPEEVFGMGISDRLLGKKNVNGHPRIDAVHPRAALPGGEVRITGSGLRPVDLRRPKVQFGDVEGAVVISSDDFLVARVPP